MGRNRKFDQPISSDLVLALVPLTGWLRLDPLVAALVALNILWTGYRMLRESAGSLMDEVADPDAVAELRRIISDHADGAIEAHDVRTRTAGSITFIEFHLVVPGRIEHALRAAISLVVSVIIVVGTWGLLRDSMNLALDAVPPGVDQAKIADFLRKLPGVAGVHDLHIWGMSTTETALTAHLVRPGAALDDDMLHHACEELKEHFGIGHTTLQVEDGSGAHPCVLQPDEVV